MPGILILGAFLDQGRMDHKSAAWNTFSTVTRPGADARKDIIKQRQRTSVIEEVTVLLEIDKKRNNQSKCVLLCWRNRTQWWNSEEPFNEHLVRQY